MTSIPDSSSRKAAGLAVMICLGLLLGAMLWAPGHSGASTLAPDVQGGWAPLTLAGYQAWFGLPGHMQPPPYWSTDPAVIDRHLAAAGERGIDAFVVNWYGPPDGLANDADRGFIDEATALLFERAVGTGVQVALMYDEGAIRWAGIPTTTYQAQVIEDLVYARRYFTHTSCLQIDGHPALFVFPYDDVEPWLDWTTIRSQIGVTLTLFDKDPDDAHAAAFDGFYAWVYPGSEGWDPDCCDIGLDYLTWFYETMKTQYAAKIAVGGVWPGFDDTDAPWTEDRCMLPRCGQTWRDTWQVAELYQPPAVLIVTWNDFEEGTAVEFGTGECLLPSRPGIALPGRREVYTHTLVNTGKLPDTLSLSFDSPTGWPVSVSLPGMTLGRHETATAVVTVTVPMTTLPGVVHTLVLTASSTLCGGGQSQVQDATAVGYGTHLPLLARGIESTGR